VLFRSLVFIGLVVSRLSGNTTLGPWGVAALYSGLINAVIGISLFAMGAAFNYLVSLFYKTPIRQGLFGKPLFKTPIENYFGLAGIALFLIGTLAAIVVLILGINGWNVTRLWLYLLGSAMLVLVGVQLLINWFLMRILSELSQRSAYADQDLNPTL
jgi:hypothetical protein